MTEHTPSEIVYDAGGLPPDARAVDALARLQLDGAPARRATRRVRGASSELQELLAFCGLVLGVGPGAYGRRASRAGSPKSGKTVAVSRKNVISATCPPESSSTCSAHGS